MDLLGAWAAANHLRNLAREVNRESYPWEHDEVAFMRHFGVEFEDYAAIVGHLSEEQHALLEATLAVNPEAAVLWVLAMTELE